MGHERDGRGLRSGMAQTPERPPFSTPAPVPAAELDVARAVARRSGRPVFAVVDPETGRRRLAGEPPDAVEGVAYVVDRRGAVRYGPAGRPEAPAAGAALVEDPARVPAAELAVARDVALTAGATVFVADPPVPTIGDDDEDEAVLLAGEAGPAFAFAPPADGSLRYTVRPSGELLVGAAAAAEPPRRIRDPGWTARTGAYLRQLRRLRERAAGLAAFPSVEARDWSRVERLVPDEARNALRPGAVVGRPGREVAALVAAEVERLTARLRAEAARLLR
jgi:hypothetical protein